MSTALGKPKKAIMMKSGLVFWVDKETAEKIEAATQADGFQHIFVRITELDQTINTAQIEGFYSPETYEEIQHIKSGEMKCRWDQWHKKVSDCDCARQARIREEEGRRQRERAAEMAPPTPEERARMAEAMLKGSEEKALSDRDSMFRGMFRHGSRSKKRMRRSTINAWFAKHGEQDVSDLAIEEDTGEAVSE